MPRRGKDHLTARVRERLAALLKQHQLTESAVARATGERQQDVNRFFQGEWKNPPLQFLDSLARVFHYTLADLMRDELPKPSLTEAEIGLLATWRTMKPGDRVAFDALIRRKTGGRT